MENMEEENNIMFKGKLAYFLNLKFETWIRK